jgi:beta-galactosidase beta subunit
MKSNNEYIPFINRYMMYKLLNYGKPYKNYTTYKPIENPENIETIYVDNQSCTDETKLEISKANLPYYVEIHYTKTSSKKKFETILKYCEIELLISKYGSKV